MLNPRGTARILALAEGGRIVTTRDADQLGIHRENLTRLVRQGSLERVGRGCYRLPDAEVGEHHGLVLAATAVPKGVICLLSALSFHEIGTQVPSEVWVAIERRSRRPRAGYPPLRVVRFGGEAFTEGVETHQLEGHPVAIYSVAKTLADAFKYRHKIGLDVAMEALREAWQDRRFEMNELHRYARICRVETVMRPYLEALVA